MQLTAVTEHPRYVEAKVRRDELQRRVGELEEALRELGTEAASDSVADRAAAIFAGERPVATKAPAKAELLAELKATRLALQRACTEVGETRNVAEAEVLEEIRPGYAREQRRLAKLVRELLQVGASGEGQLRRAAGEAGVKTFDPTKFNPLPVPQLRAWLERAERF